MSFCVFILIFAVQMLFWFGRGPIIRMFTNDPAVEELALKSIFIIVLAYVPDCIQGSIQGVIRALGVQKQGSYIALIAHDLLSVPLACLFVFKMGMDVRGLWTGVAIGTTFQAIFYTRLVLVTDW